VKRICLLGAAIAGLISIGATTAVAAAPHAASRAKAATAKTKIGCKWSLNVQVPAGTNEVTQGTTSGVQYGTTVCASIGAGLVSSPFAIDDQGDLTGKFVQYFKTGTTYGAYSLTQSSSAPLSVTTFGSASYAGTIKVNGGSGAWKGVKGKGTVTCTTPDAVHYACAAALKVVVPAS
jgi:hypothetical protein